MGFNFETIAVLRFHTLRHGVPTGSRVMGGSHTESDTDYVVYASDVMRICEMCGDVQLDVMKAVTNPEYACAFASIRLGELNLIIVQAEEDMLAWRYATMVGVQTGPHSKPKRVAIFGDALRRAYRVMGSVKANYWTAVSHRDGLPWFTPTEELDFTLRGVTC